MMRLRAAVLVVCALVVPLACDLPAEGPILEQRWSVPVERTSLSVEELLPDGVTVSGDAFLVSVDPIETGRTLASLCPACVPLDGLTLPVPAFSGAFSTSTPLPPQVVSATLVSGVIELEVRNEFAFDPLQGGGRIGVTVLDGPGGRILGRLTLDGSVGDALPPGSTLRRTLALTAGPLGGTLTTATTVDVAGGAVAQVDSNRQVRVTARPGAIRVASARVDAGGETVEVDPIELDVEDVDFDDRIHGGEVVLAVVNPFGVGVNGQVRVDHPGGSIVKPFSISPAPTSSVAIPFSADELRAFLGAAPVTLTGTGVVPADAGVTTIVPAQVLGIDVRIQLTLRIGG